MNLTRVLVMGVDVLGVLEDGGRDVQVGLGGLDTDGHEALKGCFRGGRGR